MQIPAGFELSIEDHVATLRINRPEKRNAMSVAMWRALPGLLAPLGSDPGVRVLVLATRSQLTLAATKEIVDGRADGERFRRWQEESREEVAEGVAAFMERRTPRFPWSGIIPER